MKAYINGISYNVCEGASISRRINETLDSAIIRISQVQTKIKMQPLDEVKLVVEDNDYYFDVDSYTEKITCLSPLIYNYEINLVSQTKELETILLPNLAITQLKTGTKRSVAYYLTLYLNLYGAKRRNGSGYFANKWSYRDLSIFIGIECPEFQWQTPTLREVITDLMMTANCIPTLSHGKIGYINLSERGANISKETSTYKPTIGDSSVYQVEETFDIDLTLGIFEQIVTLDADKTRFGRLDLNEKYKIISVTPVENIQTVWYSTTSKKKELKIGGQRVIGFDITKGKAKVTYKVEQVHSQSQHINYITSSRSVADHVSELKMDLKNVISSEEDKYTVAEFITFTTDSATLTDNNLQLKTQLPIYKIRNFQLCIPAYDIESASYKLRAINLCNFYGANFVFEKSEFDTKPIGNVNPTFGDNTYRDNCIYYTRGTNEIGNLLYEIEIPGATNKLCWEWWIDVMQQLYGTFSHSSANSQTGVVFKIEYDTLSSFAFTAGKSDIVNKRTVQDNQSEQFVSASRVGKLEYQKSDRLGNEVQLINARFGIDENPITEGQVYNDGEDEYVIYECTSQYFKNHIVVNGMATKNYILKDYFTGVKSKNRIWKIADASEGVERHDLHKFYLEFSKKQKTEYEYDMFDKYGYYIPKFLSSINSSSTYSKISPLKNATCVFIDSQDNEYPSKGVNDTTGTYGYIFDIVPYVVGNSIVISFGFEDNYTAFTHFDTDKFDNTDFNSAVNTISTSFTNDNNGVPMRQLPYANSDGEFKTQRIFLSDRSQTVPIKVDDTIGTSVTDVRNFLWKIYRRPKIAIPVDDFQFSKTIYKDNREIIKTSVQFEYCSDTHDIAFTDKFIKMQQFVRNVQGETNFKVYTGDYSSYNHKNLTLAETEEVVGGSFTITVIDYGARSGSITFNNVPDNKAYYIVDSNGDILLASKGVKTIYLNILVDRDTNEYDSTGAIIGSIVND